MDGFASDVKMARGGTKFLLTSRPDPLFVCESRLCFSLTLADSLVRLSRFEIPGNVDHNDALVAFQQQKRFQNRGSFVVQKVVIPATLHELKADEVPFARI